MKVRTVAACLHATGIVALIGGAAQAATGSAQPVESSSMPEAVIVTGSRIPQAADELVSSERSVITVEQIEQRGFTTVYEALQSFTQMSGATQNEQFAGFTQNANVIDMRGLGSGHTLVLLNGRRMADYPLPYDSRSNFVNIASIPVAAVERIEVLSGGASAIYGSDAIAGVVNIILKQHLDTPLDISARYGDTSDGGGRSQRIQGVGSFNRDTLNVTYAAEYLNRDPIYGFQRGFMDSVQDNPNPVARIDARSILREGFSDANFSGVGYIDPGASACSQWPELHRSFRPGRGFYCGQSNADAQASIENGRDQFSLYTNAEWTPASATWFGSVNYFHTRSEADANHNFWYPLSNLVYNTRSGLLESLQRYFLPSEIGGRDQKLTHFNEQSINVVAGVKGAVGSSSWKYEFSLNHSGYDVSNKSRVLLTDETQNYFLGPQLGRDPGFNAFPAFSYDPAKLYTPITPAIYDQITAIRHDTAHSFNDVASATITGDVFSLPAGPVAVSGLIEWGRQHYRIDLDPRLLASDFWAVQDTGGHGERSRYAAGIEARAPLLETLTASAAARYDRYDDSTQGNGKTTYNLGLEFRPIEQLRLNGRYATSFRAPDMHYVFADRSGFFQYAADEYLCRRDEPGVSFAACTNGAVNVQGARQGNRSLQAENGKSYTLGLVWQPWKRTAFSAEYYRIKIDGLVIDNPVDRILQLEADCRLGSTMGGAPVDTSSAQCADAIAHVQRRSASGPSPEQLQLITTGPINSAHRDTSGIDANFSYLLDTVQAGRYSFAVGYSHVLKDELQNFAGDPVKDFRADPLNFAFRSKVNGSIGWSYADFTTTIFAERLGTTPTKSGEDRVPAVIYCNLSLAYRFLGDKAEASFVLDNVFNRDPPRDATNTIWPYFSVNNYSSVGREWFLQLRYRLPT